MKYRFAWKLSYRSVAEFEVHGDGPCYRIQERRKPLDWERADYAGPEDRWVREVLGSVGTIHRCGAMGVPISWEVVEAFNAWRQAEHDRIIGAILADRRYDGLDRGGPLFDPPPVVRGAHFIDGVGWIVRNDATVGRAA
jgi:hypothetical protein